MCIRDSTILAASQMLQSWVSVALVAGVIVAAFIGAMIGKRIVKKDVYKRQQLVARNVRIVEVRGSNPLRSTISPP